MHKTDWKSILLLLAAFSVPASVDAEEYLLFHNADLKTPRLGDGYDPVKRPADRVRASAVLLTPDVRRTDSLQTSVSIHELTENRNRLSGKDGSATAALEQVLQVELQTQDYVSIFEEHSVFVVQAMVINRTEEATDMQLKKKAQDLPDDAFRQKYGVRVVDRIDYGGHIFLIYVFRTRKDEVRRKIIISLQGAYSDVSEKASLTSYLEKCGVTNEYTMHTLQDGGDIAPFLNPNLADFRGYLERWVAAVGRHPAAVRFYTARYHDAMPDFPHRWVLGFGSTFSKE